MPPRLPADRAVRPLEVAVVGNDTVLAALPARAMQLAHAMLACGYDLVVPVSWGEEALAEYALRTLDARGGRPVVYCACPALRERLLASGNELAPFLLTLVPPLVATARYVRALQPDVAMHITAIGGCPGARDASIDSRIGAHDFLQLLASRGIALDRMPAVFDSIIPPDRRRHYSLPGGCPAPKALESRAPERRLVTITEDAFSTELAEHLLGRESVLIDLTPRLGCACCGGSATRGASVPGTGRELILRHEPPRAHAPVLDHDLEIHLELSTSETAEGARTGRERAAERGERQEHGERGERPEHFRLPGAQPIGSARARPERPRIAVTPAGVAEVPAPGRPAAGGSVRVPSASPPAARSPIAPGTGSAGSAGSASSGGVAGRGADTGGARRAIEGPRAAPTEGREREVARSVARGDTRGTAPSSGSATSHEGGASPDAPSAPPAARAITAASPPVPPTPTSPRPVASRGEPPGATSLAARDIATWSAPSRPLATDTPPPATTTSPSLAGVVVEPRRAMVAPAPTRRRFLLGRGTGHPRVHASDGKVLPRAYARHTPPGMRAVEEATRSRSAASTIAEVALLPVVVDERWTEAPAAHDVVESVVSGSVVSESVVSESAVSETVVSETVVSETVVSETIDVELAGSELRRDAGASHIDPANDDVAADIAVLEAPRLGDAGIDQPMPTAATMEAAAEDVARRSDVLDEKRPVMAVSEARADVAAEVAEVADTFGTGELGDVVVTPPERNRQLQRRGAPALSPPPTLSPTPEVRPGPPALSRPRRETGTTRPSRDAHSHDLRERRETHERDEPLSLAFFVATVVLVVAVIVALAVIFRRPPTAP